MCAREPGWSFSPGLNCWALLAIHCPVCVCIGLALCGTKVFQLHSFWSDKKCSLIHQFVSAAGTVKLSVEHDLDPNMTFGNFLRRLGCYVQSSLGKSRLHPLKFVGRESLPVSHSRRFVAQKCHKVKVAKRVICKTPPSIVHWLHHVSHDGLEYKGNVLNLAQWEEAVYRKDEASSSSEESDESL